MNEVVTTTREIAVEMPDTTALTARLDNLACEAEMVSVVDEASLASATATMNDCAALGKLLDAKRKEAKKPFLDGGRDVDAHFMPFVERCNTIVGEFKKGISAYIAKKAAEAEAARRKAEEEAAAKRRAIAEQIERERRAAEEKAAAERARQAAIRAEQERAAREAAAKAASAAEAERIKREAEEAAKRAEEEAKRREEEAARVAAAREELLQQKQAAVVAAPVVVEPAKTDGLVYRTVWKAQVTDKKAFLLSLVNDHPDFLSLVTVDTAELNRLVNKREGDTIFAGVEAHKEQVVVTRGTRRRVF